MTSIGVFGKIPGQGDFVDRGLPSSFIGVWDDWLQRSIASSREQYGKAWLDYYLTSPIWRFVLSGGSVDGSAWAGILVPSVDSVGRYFPLTILKPLRTDENLFMFLRTNKQWFEGLENVALGALEERLTVDGLMENFNLIKTPAACESVSLQLQSGLRGGCAIAADSADDDPVERGLEPLVHALIVKECESYGLWSCQGSEYMPPMFNISSGLPSAQSYSAFLDGQWKHWGWGGS
ncbi:MAG: type VI secretion system protein ImpM [Flavobacteriales bacterium]|jgi:type VI secretion system protein ImpM